MSGAVPDRSADSVRSVSRAVAVLRQFDAGDRRLGLAELSVATGLAKSTLTRLLGTLETEGLLARGTDGRYRPGLELVRWGGLAAELPPVPAEVTEQMAALTREIGESTTFYVRRGPHRVALARAESDRTLRHIVPLHQPMPLHRGAAAWVLLGDADDDVLTDVQGRADRDGLGIDVRGRVAAARTAGFAVSEGEREPGVTGVAVPVHGPDGCSVVAVVAVGGPSGRFGADGVEAAVTGLQGLAAAASGRVAALAVAHRTGRGS